MISLCLSLCAYIVDLIVRYCITSKTIVDGEARVLPGQVTHIRFKKCFPYLPGQYCFLRIEVLDSMQYHPFSLASSSDQEHTSFYCRALVNNYLYIYNKTTYILTYVGIALSMFYFKIFK